MSALSQLVSDIISYNNNNMWEEFPDFQSRFAWTMVII